MNVYYKRNRVNHADKEITFDNEKISNVISKVEWQTGIEFIIATKDENVKNLIEEIIIKINDELELNLEPSSFNLMMEDLKSDDFLIIADNESSEYFKYSIEITI